ncbi:MAG: ferritin-like domain-containing protein, partial [Chloroflexi bacterium]|nr:ferritin-like domain-containing protein [Chloroflexota bacterium]
MNEKEQAQYETTLVEYLKARISRSQMLLAAGASLALAAVPRAAGAQVSGNGFGPGQGFSAPYYPQVQGTYTPEAIQSILNTAITAEHLAVTLLTAAVGPGSKLGLSGVLLNVVQAALVEEQLHLDFLASAGATPGTTTFTVPDPKILTDQGTFFSTVEIAENFFVAAYMTAAREFAELGQPTLAKYAYQIGSVEAEHRVLARGALALAGVASAIPPNNKAFETDYFLYTRDAAAVI